MIINRFYKTLIAEIIYFKLTRSLPQKKYPVGGQTELGVKGNDVKPEVPSPSPNKETVLDEIDNMVDAIQLG